ncbi:fimbria/pilus periplasmic chaperone [Vibrio brasiliensis]
MNYSFLLVLILVSFGANSAFILNSTRYIYNENDSSISMEVRNKSKDAFGGKVDVRQNNAIAENFDSSSPMILPSPPVFKVKGKSKQNIKLKLLNGTSLPKDRESLFWLSVQEIPLLKRVEGNAISLAMNIKVKLFYRPSALLGKRYGAEENIRFRYNNGNIILENRTPFHFAITDISIEGVKDNDIQKSVRDSLSLFLPYSELVVAENVDSFPEKISIESIDDWGAFQSYDIELGL